MLNINNKDDFVKFVSQFESVNQRVSAVCKLYNIHYDLVSWEYDDINNEIFVETQGLCRGDIDRDSGHFPVDYLFMADDDIKEELRKLK